MISVLAHIDLFQLPFLLYFNGSKKRHSNIGITLSLGLISFLIFQFQDSNLVQKINPNVVSQTLDTLHAASVTFDENHFLYIHVDVGKILPVDPIYISVVFTEKQLHVTEDGTVEQIGYPHDLHRCTKEDFAFNESLYASLGLNSTYAYCLGNKSFFVEGTQSESDQYFATIEVGYCNNETLNNTCKSVEEITEFLETNKAVVGVNYFIASIDSNNYANPMQESMSTDYIKIDPDLEKQRMYYLMNVEVHTDNSWLFSNDKFEAGFKNSYTDVDYLIRHDNSTNLAEFYIYADNRLTTINRTYQKLPDALASLVGIAHLIMFLCFLCTNSANQLISLKLILNELYTFPQYWNQNKNQNRNNMEKKYIVNNEENSPQLHHRELDSPIISSQSQKIHEPINVEMQHPIISLQNLKEEKDFIGPLKSESEPLEKIEIYDNFCLEHYSKNDAVQNINPQHETNDKECIIIENKNLEECKTENKNMKESINENKNMKESPNNPILESKMSRVKFFFKKVFNQENDNAKLQIGLLEYIKCKIGIFFKLQGNKYKLVKKAEQVLVQELDIIRLLQKLHEIEKLKLLLLNEDQLVLFDSISKPVLDIGDDGFDVNSHASLMTKLIKNYKDKKDMNSILRYYKTVDTNRTTNPLNDKLISLIDDKIILSNKD